MDERAEGPLASVAPLAALGTLFFCEVCLIQLIQSRFSGPALGVSAGIVAAGLLHPPRAECDRSHTVRVPFQRAVVRASRCVSGADGTALSSTNQGSPFSSR